MYEPKEKDLYNIALKLLLRYGDKLLIIHDIFKEWDLPGGRILPDEFHADFAEVLKRKMGEELGPDVEYTIGKPVVFFRVERIEQDGRKARIFAIGYEAQYKGGEIRLGGHHDKLEWVDVKTFDPEKYFTGGWLIGIKDYIAGL
jgi:hypothetical protein